MSKSFIMRQPIRQLSPYITTLIAAGEIIKRPDDIVRELIDNSIDAGANQIEVSITQGGLEMIQIRDNGSGIPKDELSLALMHHATNKIRVIEDIEQVQTLGFRGEALASISAVARVSLSSRTQDSAHGWQITTEPGQPSSSPKPVTHPIGTTVCITDLFHSIPARRHFLRTPATEFARIHQWIKCLSINHIDVSFSVEHNKRSILKCLTQPDIPNHRLSRLAILYGIDFAKVAIEIEKIDTSISLYGWLSPPSFSRSQPDWQRFYVNRRLIKDKMISYAVKQAYQDILYRDRNPVVALFLKLDSAEVDFNVHPAKAEVRFRKPQTVYECLYKSIKQVLNKPSLSQESLVDIQPIESSKEDMHASFTPNKLRNTWISQQSAVTHNPTLFITDTQPAPIKAHQTSLEHETGLFHQSLGHPLAQLHGTYILAQNDKGLIVIDTHAAHERILYEQLKQSFIQNTPRRQQLLIQLSLNLSPQEIELSERHYEVFQKIGFEYTISSGQLIIHSVPQLLSNISLEELIKDVLNDLRTNGLSMRLEAQQNRLLSSIACHQAIRANRLMSLKEMDQLLRSMEVTPHSGQCNHGRPTSKQITLKEIDSWFLRGR